MKCFHWHEHGHYKTDCPKNPKNNKRKERSEALIAEDEEPLKKQKEDPRDLYYWEIMKMMIGVSSTRFET